MKPSDIALPHRSLNATALLLAHGARGASWLDRLERWASGLRRRDLEAYLAGSQDIFEVERRLRDIERRER